jgi:hypothetical protein
MEVKIDYETLKAVNYRLSQIELYLVNILDGIRQAERETCDAEILIYQVRELLEKQTKEQNNDK